MKNIKFIIYIVLISCLAFFGFRVFAATNIDGTDYNHWAWNDVVGWIDFYSTNDVYVSGTSITGNASSSVGYISFDCATSPDPPADCSTTFPDWQVTNNGSGYLSGWAWNDGIGWISFDCHDTSDNCVHSNYQVRIVDSEFTDWAWNDIVGWISFNCSKTDTCATVDYKVKISSSGITANAYLTSSTFDTGAAGGVSYNVLMYQGSKPTGTQVGFQLAASNSADGPWDFKGYDGSDTTYYAPTGPNVPIALNSSLYNNKRYYRYKIFLNSNINQTATPQVDDIVISWSR